MSTRTSGALLKVLATFMDGPSEERYGLELIRATRLKSGTLYPLLERLEAAGWLASRWDEPGQSHSGGPRRRFYRLTGEGIARAQETLVEYSRAGSEAWA